MAKGFYLKQNEILFICELLKFYLSSIGLRSWEKLDLGLLNKDSMII